MNTTPLIPATFVLAALIIGSACSASTTDSSGTMTTPESTVETAPPTSPSVPRPVPTARPTTTPPTTLPPTTSPTTTSPTTTEPPAEPASIDAVDVSGGTVFGIRTFDAIDIDAVAGDVSARLGSPTLDSGWQSMAGQIDCTGSTEFRVLWWGDFRMTFERYQGDGAVRDELSAWTVGDPNLFGPVPIGDVPPASPSNLVTLEGIGLGSTRADLGAVWANLNNGGDGRLVVIDRGGSLVITLDGGDRVVGFGDGPFDCPTDEPR